MNPAVEALNEAGRAWWVYVFHATWTSSLVAAALLAVVRLGRRWPAQVRHAIILIALVKFAVPPMLTAPIGLFSWFGPAITRGAGDSAPPGGEAAVSASPGVFGAMAGITWQAWLMLAHASGCVAAAGLVLADLAKLLRLSRRARAVAAGPLHARFLRLSREMGFRRPPRLLLSAEPVPPMAFGVLRRRVMLPASLVEAPASPHARTVLAHEMAHHRRGDPCLNLLQTALNVVWWFNPLVRALNHALRRASEDCCDDLVLSRDSTTGETYCAALLKVASGLSRRPMLGAALGFVRRLHPLGARMMRIMDPQVRRWRKLSWVALTPMVVLAALVLPGLPTEAPPEQAPLAVVDQRPAGGDGEAPAVGRPEPLRAAGDAHHALAGIDAPPWAQQGRADDREGADARLATSAFPPAGQDDDHGGAAANAFDDWPLAVCMDSLGPGAFQAPVADSSVATQRSQLHLAAPVGFVPASRLDPGRVLLAKHVPGAGQSAGGLPRRLLRPQRVPRPPDRGDPLARSDLGPLYDGLSAPAGLRGIEGIDESHALARAAWLGAPAPSRDAILADEMPGLPDDSGTVEAPIGLDTIPQSIDFYPVVKVPVLHNGFDVSPSGTLDYVVLPGCELPIVGGPQGQAGSFVPWDSTLQVAAAPGPAAVWPLAVGGLMLLRRRRLGRRRT